MTSYGSFSPAQGAPQSRLVLVDGILDLRWFHCSATAEFIGDFFAPSAAAVALDAHDTRHSIGYLANEIIENAVKFRAPGAGDVVIESSLRERHFELRVANFVAEDTSTRFRALLEEILAGDPGELLIQRIEANALEEGSGSGLGLLTLMNDYGAQLGWRFERASGITRVETQAVLGLG